MTRFEKTSAARPITDEMIERARKEFWRVLQFKELKVEDAWRTALEAALNGAKDD